MKKLILLVLLLTLGGIFTFLNVSNDTSISKQEVLETKNNYILVKPEELNKIPKTSDNDEEVKVEPLPPHKASQPVYILQLSDKKQEGH